MNKKINYQAPVSVTNVLKSVSVFCASPQSSSSIETLTEKYDWEDELWD